MSDLRIQAIHRIEDHYGDAYKPAMKEAVYKMLPSTMERLQVVLDELFDMYERRYQKRVPEKNEIKKAIDQAFRRHPEYTETAQQDLPALPMPTNTLWNKVKSIRMAPRYVDWLLAHLKEDRTWNGETMRISQWAIKDPDVVGEIYLREVGEPTEEK